MPGQIWGGVGVAGPILSQVEIIQLSCSDLSTVLAVATSVAYFRIPKTFILTEVLASLLVASSSGVVTVDINKNGVSILSTKLTVDANEKTSLTAAAGYVISDSAMTRDAEITFDIDTAGTGAKGLIVTLLGVYS
jgi:hypothetical protein